MFSDDPVIRHRNAINLSAAMVAVLAAAVPALAGPDDFSTYPNLGRYRNFFSSLCGKNGVDENPAAIPEVGCFAIKAGGSLDGKINGRAASIRLDANSNETFYIDGTEIRRTGASTTNDPLVKLGAAGLVFCSKETPNDCPRSHRYDDAPARRGRLLRCRPRVHAKDVRDQSGELGSGNSKDAAAASGAEVQQSPSRFSLER